MKSVAPLAALAGLAFAWPNAAPAEPAGGRMECPRERLLNGRLGEIGLAKVVGAGRLRFQDNEPDCLDRERNCTSRAYLVPGDVVVTAERRGERICVAFPNATATHGAVDAARLAPLPVAAQPPLDAWTGEWLRDDQASLTIRLGADGLEVDGYAEWQGAAPGEVHNGGLSHVGRPQGDTLTPAGKDGDVFCKPVLRLLGPYLAVVDNDQCGGMNVTFSGLYRRQ